jgi:NitT/TauT family transport system substrate-binding protein
MSRVRRLLVVAVLVAISACPAARETPARRPDEVTAVVIPVLFTAPFYIAQAEGYFADENLDVEFVRLARNIDAIPALAQGEVSVGAGQVTVAVLNAIAAGADIRVVGGTGHLAADGCTFHGFIVRRELVTGGGAVDAEVLRGRRVELDIALPHAYWLDRALQPLGLEIADLEVVDLPMTALVDAFHAGTYDLTGLDEPRLTRLLASGDAVLWKATQQIVPDYPQSVLLFGPDLLEERPDVGRRFLSAYRRAIRQYNQGKTPRNLDILSTAMRLSRNELAAMCWVAMDDDARIRTAGLGDYQRWALQRGLVNRVVADDELVDRRFTAEAPGR